MSRCWSMNNQKQKNSRLKTVDKKGDEGHPFFMACRNYQKICTTDVVKVVDIFVFVPIYSKSCLLML